MWRASIITLFPEMFPGPLGYSLIGKALGQKWALDMVALRDFGIGNHHAVDDTPAGGGPGMVIRADVAAAALDSIPADNRPRLLMTPRGEPLTQKKVRQWSEGTGLVIFCPRFEGIDERIIKARNLIPVCIGDYVLSGGEVAAMALVEACVRLVPDVMGSEASGVEESFEADLLEYAHYTRPSEFEGYKIPDVLLSGNHAKISAWRTEEATTTTLKARPDLLKGR
jgi:tRNA (guanine37-N1)-methyltransferase